MKKGEGKREKMDYMAANHPGRPTRVRYPLEGKDRESKEDVRGSKWDRELTVGHLPPQLAIRLYGNDKGNCYMGRRVRVGRPNCMEKVNGTTAICLT